MHDVSLSCNNVRPMTPHRAVLGFVLIAMALAIAALSARGPSTIDGAEAVAVSYPGFFEALGRLVA